MVSGMCIDHSLSSGNLTAVSEITNIQIADHFAKRTSISYDKPVGSKYDEAMSRFK